MAVGLLPNEKPGKPYQNGYIEQFNRTFREDVLDAYVFENFSQLKIKSNKWQKQ
ncbi:MAG: transposase [Bacteroidetes bacterium]|nr:transposase [Bacteroidota bacterium]